MTESQQDTLEEKYEVLKTVCRQQVVINESLKLEIIKLHNVINELTSDKNLLLDEFVNNHLSCISSLKSELKETQDNSVCRGNKRAMSPSENNYQDTKKVRSSHSAICRKEESVLLDDSSPPLYPIPVEENEEPFSPDDQAEQSHCEATPSHSPLTITCPKLHYNISIAAKTSISATPIGSDGETSPRLVNTSSITLKSNVSNPGSPPTITSNTRLPTSSPVSTNNISVLQRPSRGSSLVTNSSVCASPTPFVSFASQRSSSLGSHAKYVSVTNRSLKVVSSGNAPNTSGNVIKSVTSPISSGIRLSSTPALTNQRILIQPSNCNVRSAVFPRQPQVKDSCEFGYTER
ncbi:unnamed protein product [Trichobilharzia szidati]|nr:unnamed protein product [Trichobilharzia szidati]